MCECVFSRLFQTDVLVLVVAKRRFCVSQKGKRVYYTKINNHAYSESTSVCACQFIQYAQPIQAQIFSSLCVQIVFNSSFVSFQDDEKTTHSSNEKTNTREIRLFV